MRILGLKTIIFALSGTVATTIAVLSIFINLSSCTAEGAIIIGLVFCVLGTVWILIITIMLMKAWRDTLNINHRRYGDNY